MRALSWAKGWDRNEVRTIATHCDHCKEDTILCSLELVFQNQGTGLGVEVRTKVESDARKKEC